MLSILTDEENNGVSFIGYYPNLFSKEFTHLVSNYCNSQNDFRDGQSSFGKDIPRLQKWYQTDGQYFCPSWRGRYKRWESFNYDKTLTRIQNKTNIETDNIVQEFSYFQKPVFNSCLINYYRDGDDSIKLHYDNTDVFGEKPTIAIVSIGESRDIYFHRSIRSPIGDKTSIKLDNKNKHLNTKITLEDGSLLIMAGDTQNYYLHEIPKSKEEKGARFSLTFRHYL